MTARTEGSSPTPRAQPFYCPFCGEGDFVPFGEEPGRFLCNSCSRHFIVRFVGLDAGADAGGKRDAV